ncbi:hypothetical protein BSKO_05306 [Bryopsis sp. KO-2023]|nr:hypothetical protein BSKO_05306 [Bryopsis sp. KO-2023]
MSTEEVLRSRSANGTIIVMIATGGYSAFLANMACRLRSLGLENFAMVALDEGAWEMCKQRNFPAVNASALLEGSGVGRGGAFSTQAEFHSAEFKSIAKVKQRAVSKALGLGLDVVMTDVDIAWLRNPLPYFNSKEVGALLRQWRQIEQDMIPQKGFVLVVVVVEDFDFIVQSDSFSWLAPLHELNSGFYFVRHGDRSTKSLQRVIDIATENPTTREQTSFHEGLCGRPGILTHLLWRRRCVTTFGAKVVALDRRKFPNGHNFFVDWGPSKALAAQPYIVHFNWLDGAETKSKKMKEQGMWIVNDDGECVAGQIFEGTSPVCGGSWGLVFLVGILLGGVLLWRSKGLTWGKKKVSFRRNPTNIRHGFG